MADYHVVLLAEEELSTSDAEQVTGLHRELVDEGERVVYHLLVPEDDAAARVEAAMGSLSGGEMLASPVTALPPEELEKAQEQAHGRATASLRASLDRLQAAGGTAEGRVIAEHPVDALIAEVGACDGREAIVLTRSHVVAEFFHVDWTSQARRKLGVPVLHLLEHETFEEQGPGAGEGNTGL